jgi:hypothetical protein
VFLVLAALKRNLPQKREKEKKEKKEKKRKK